MQMRAVSLSRSSLTSMHLPKRKFFKTITVVAISFNDKNIVIESAEHIETLKDQFHAKPLLSLNYPMKKTLICYSGKTGETPYRA